MRAPRCCLFRLFGGVVHGAAAAAAAAAFGRESKRDYAPKCARITTHAYCSDAFSMCTRRDVPLCCRHGRKPKTTTPRASKIVYTERQECNVCVCISMQSGSTACDARACGCVNAIKPTRPLACARLSFVLVRGDNPRSRAAAQPKTTDSCVDVVVVVVSSLCSVFLAWRFVYTMRCVHGLCTTFLYRKPHAQLFARTRASAIITVPTFACFRRRRRPIWALYARRTRTPCTPGATAKRCVIVQKC